MALERRQVVCRQERRCLDLNRWLQYIGAKFMRCRSIEIMLSDHPSEHEGKNVWTVLAAEVSGALQD